MQVVSHSPAGVAQVRPRIWSLKRCGAAAGIVVVLLWIASFWWWAGAGYASTTHDTVWRADILGGRLVIGGISRNAVEHLAEVPYAWSPGWNFYRGKIDERVRVDLRFIWWRYPGLGWCLFVPLWAPVLGAGAVWAVGWRRERRRAVDGGCAGCGYDRSGIAAASVCPECGAAQASHVPQAPRPASR